MGRLRVARAGENRAQQRFAVIPSGLGAERLREIAGSGSPGAIPRRGGPDMARRRSHERRGSTPTRRTTRSQGLAVAFATTPASSTATAIVIGLAAAGLIAFGALGAQPASAGEAGPALAQAGDLAREGLARLGQLPPFAFFGAMAVLCVLPVPVSAFYLGGAALYGTGATLAWLPFALAGNVWLAQTLAARGLRPLAARVLTARGLRVPMLREGDALPFTVLIRIAPGVPFFAQNLLLGLAEVDRLRSIAVALPIQLAFASGFILLGRSAFEGRLGMLVLALGLIASVSLAARLAHRRLAAHAPAELAER